MMVKLEFNQIGQIVPLFEGYTDTLLWSCLQGIMGDAWADSSTSPICAQIITADFCYFAGDSSSPEAFLLVKNIPASFPGKAILMIPENEEWGALIEQAYANRFSKFTRYALKKEKGIFDTGKLKAYIDKLPDEYTLKPVDEQLYRLTMKEEWSSDLCSQFHTYEDFRKLGLGYIVLHEGVPVSGASSYTVYSEGIEIQVDTKKEYRHKGLATVCASALILECLDRGLYPSWDAANKVSAALAEKLGYHFDREYTAYQIDLL